MSIQTNMCSYSNFVAKNLVEFTPVKGQMTKTQAINGSVITRVGAGLAGIVSVIEVFVAAICRFLTGTVLQFLPRGLIIGSVKWSQDANEGAGLLWKILCGNYTEMDETTRQLKKSAKSFLNCFKTNE